MAELPAKAWEQVGPLWACERKFFPRLSWYQNVWLKPERIAVTSIGAAVKELKKRAPYWAHLPDKFHRRSTLVQEQLPKARLKEFNFGDAGTEIPTLPTKKWGAWTLLAEDLLLCSTECASPFPNGECFFGEAEAAPSGAYKKLWETFLRTQKFPRAGEKVLDLGASPGSWTWALRRLGAEVLSVDGAKLRDDLMVDSQVKFIKKDAFKLRASDLDFRPTWIFSDIICEPERLLEIYEYWNEEIPQLNFVFTLKFKSIASPNVVEKFRALPGSQIHHLFHNKHELMWTQFNF